MRAVFAALAPVAGMLVACGGADSTGVFEELMGLVPDTPEVRRQVLFTDFERLRELRRIELPTDPADPEQQRQYLLGLLGAADPRTGGSLSEGVLIYAFPLPGFSNGRSRTFIFDIVSTHEASIGFGFEAVDQLLAAGGFAPGESEYAVAAGAFDPTLAEQLLTECAGCALRTDMRRYRDQRYFGWGDSGSVTRPLSPPAFDAAGIAFRLAFRDRYVLRSGSTAQMEALIDAALGDGSLASNEDYLLVARGLEELDSYTAFVTDRTQGPEMAAAMLSAFGDDAQSAALRAAWARDAGVPLLQPYDLVGFGVAYSDSGGFYTTLVLVHGSEGAARANGELLARRIATVTSVLTGTPWSLLIETVETEVDGRVLQATLRPREGATVVNAVALFSRFDPLLLHE